MNQAADNTQHSWSGCTVVMEILHQERLGHHIWPVAGHKKLQIISRSHGRGCILTVFKSTLHLLALAFEFTDIYNTRRVQYNLRRQNPAPRSAHPVLWHTRVLMTAPGGWQWLLWLWEWQAKTKTQMCQGLSSDSVSAVQAVISHCWDSQYSGKTDTFY